MTGVRLFSLLNPAIGIVFATVFLVLWLNQRKRVYILAMAGAALSYAVAVLVQVFGLPPDSGANALVSCAFYLLSVSLFLEAALMRVGMRRNVYVIGALSVVIFSLIYYFYYIDKNLQVRIYVLNVGAGLLFCFGALRMGMASTKKPIDWVLFWLLLLIGLHFFPRTLLTLLADGPEGLRSVENFRQSLFWSVLSFALVILSLLICLSFLLAIALDIIDDLEADRKRDPLTPLLNRRGFEEAAQKCLARRPVSDICLVFCDIDHFKQVNDRFGHAAGDEAIRLVGQWIGETVRHGDVAGRIGGEEFAILLPGAGREQALALAERLRARVEEGRFPSLPDGQRVTASFGVAEAGIGEPLEYLMRRADEMLYRAKRNGRNRVEG